ncbi:MAG: hypothetical protein KC621_23410 [Myxococcales bacterium]|nr:hypothetical protein [Myxococcales bacterium]
MRRPVSVLSVAEPGIWAELAVHVDLDRYVIQAVDDCTRLVDPSFEARVEALAGQGLPVLLRWKRRPVQVVERAVRELGDVVRSLAPSTRQVLLRAQRHATGEGRLHGRCAWDPAADGEHVRRLLSSALIERVPEEDDVWVLNPDLPDPEPPSFDAEEAVMEETDDLGEPGAGPIALLHDVASLAVAIDAVGPRRTAAGTLSKTDVRKLCKHLGLPGLDLASDARWGRALRALEALGAVTVDPIARTLHLDLGLEVLLQGDTPDAVDHLVHRLVEEDLQELVGLIRDALRQAGTGALDEVVLLDLLREQHRDVIFHAWSRDGRAVYPVIADEDPRPYDERGWDEVETPMVRAAFSRLVRLGLLRRAPGVIAATHEGRVWARVEALPMPPVWATGDLEIVVPPHGVSPWERLQIERFSRCVSRDVVDRYKLDRKGLERWLAVHDVDEAAALLRRRCAGLPAGVEQALRAWANSATRIVLLRGEVLE